MISPLDHALPNGSRLPCTVLIVDDQDSVRTLLGALLGSHFETVFAADVSEARKVLDGRQIDIVLTDQEMPGDSGVQLLEWVRHHSPATIRILMTANARIEDLAAAINCGQVHRYVFKPWRNDEMLELLRGAARQFWLERSYEHLLEELRRLNVELERRVAERTRELEQANRQLQQRNVMLQKMALTDALTGLPNRRGMDRLARNEIMRRARTPAPLTVGLIDADHFKAVNSGYTLSGGDHALVWLAQTMAGCVRTIDSIGRVGGEEFMLIAPETDAAGAASLGERVRRTVEQGHTVYQGEPIRLTVSLGLVIVAPNLLLGYDQIRHEAAAAVEQAKREGRNRCVFRMLETEDDLIAPTPSDSHALREGA